MVEKLVKWVVLTLNLSKLAIFCLQNLEPFVLGMARIWTTSYPVNRAQGTLYNKLLIIFLSDLLIKVDDPGIVLQDVVVLLQAVLQCPSLDAI